jgi:hypothetical protein
VVGSSVEAVAEISVNGVVSSAVVAAETIEVAVGIVMSSSSQGVVGIGSSVQVEVGFSFVVDASWELLVVSTGTVGSAIEVVSTGTVGSGIEVVVSTGTVGSAMEVGSIGTVGSKVSNGSEEV